MATGGCWPGDVCGSWSSAAASCRSTLDDLVLAAILTSCLWHRHAIRCRPRSTRRYLDPCRSLNLEPAGWDRCLHPAAAPRLHLRPGEGRPWQARQEAVRFVSRSAPTGIEASWTIRVVGTVGPSGPSLHGGTSA